MPRKVSVSNLEDHLGYWLRLVSNHVSHSFKLKIEAHGVTVAEWVLLRSLFAGKEFNPSQIAAELDMTRGTISKLTERLVTKRLVSAREDKYDRRYQTVQLTAAGRKLVPRLAALADENDATYFGDFSDKQRGHLLHTLKEIATRRNMAGSPLE